MKGFGLRLENLREQYGYTKKEVSIKLGFSPNVYGSYEREERRPSYETLIKLADLYNVSLDFLICGKEDNPTLDSTNKLKSIEEILNHFNTKGVENPYILDKEKWLILRESDLVELTNHFDWVVTKARKEKK